MSTPNVIGFETELLTKLARERALAVEGLTESQFVEALRQAIASGDFQRHVLQDGRGQEVTYIPWRVTEDLRAQYNELLYAVASCHPGESRHETALRYIRERAPVPSGTADAVPRHPPT